MTTVEQLFEALRNADAAGNEEDARRIAAIIQRELGEGTAQQQPSLQYQDQNPEESIDAGYLRSDPSWIEASRIMYRRNYGEDFQGTDEEAADYGINTMGWFNYNLPAMGTYAARLRSSDQQEKEAFLYLMDAYDDLGFSLGGTWRFVRGVATDPTTYVGLGSFGIGSAAATGSRQAIRQGIREMIRAGTRAGVVAGTEGAIYGAADQTIRQSIEIDAGRREGYDAGEIATSAGLGAAGGGILGGVTGAAARALQSRGQSRSLLDETEDLLGGAERAAEAPEGGQARAVPEGTISPPSEAPTASAGQSALEEAPAVLPQANEATPTAVRASAAPPSTPAEHARSLLSDIVDNIRETGKHGAVGVVDNVQRMDVMRSSTNRLAGMLREAADNGEDLSGFLVRMEATAAQIQVLKDGAHQATDSFKREIFALNQRVQQSSNPQEIVALRQSVDELDAMLATVERVDTELSTQSGRDLRMRREGLSVGDLRGTSVKSLMENQGLTRAQAEHRFNQLVAQRERYLLEAENLRELDAEISTAVRTGDFTEATRLKARRKTILNRSDAQTTSDGSLMGKILRGFNRTMDALSEIMISMVFSPSTLIVNIVPSGIKMLYRPVLDALMRDPFSRAAYREVAAGYGAMASMVPSAFRASIAAYRFERNFLLDDAGRMFENGYSIPKRFGGGLMRVFPRLLQATDEFFSQISYRGYVVGHATGRAYEEGLAAGLKGRKLDAFVRRETRDVAERAFSTNVKKDERIIDILMDQALDRGLSGGRADAWIKKQLNSMPDVYRRAENEAGRDYVKDLLFKREFSGNTTPSALAQGYERFVRKHPVMRVMGQLFFRTPVRVFEEGIRLTPGLNLISPNFMADLSGKNGALRQVRAQGEAMLSYAYAGVILTLYAQGNITGASPSDYRQRRQGENTEDFEPYTIRLPNGDRWSFRNIDPLSTPLKIIVNALERYEMLHYRQTQGEHVDDTDLEMALAYVKVGTGAIAQAIRDASLTQGIDQIMTGVELMVSENDTSGQLIRFLGQKLQMLVPNTWYKAQMMSDPVINDPATIEQMLIQRINPHSEEVPRMYTALGRVRTLSNPEANMFIFSPSTAEERRRGIPEHELEVEQQLWVLAQVADTDFQAPYKHPFMGEVDLRTRYTQDGRETLYDRWMRYTHESSMINDLYVALVQHDLPYGTPSTPGPRVQIAREILNTYRNAAMLRILSEETGLTEEYVARRIRAGDTRMGRRDDPRVPF